MAYERPWLTLNGVSSENIDGLLVSELPPIRKPAMRYEAEEVDGRDGDIVTTLGYKAYDKTIKVGLHGDFDIDMVIEFFTSSGRVTFSNEPDKWYSYQVLDAIDFERLVRYRTAEVKLHVQPYKHSVMERAKTWAFDNVSQSVKVKNSGNTFSTPTITLAGSGTIGLYLNGTQVLTITMPDSGRIVIDVEGQNAYDGGNFANRLVIGDYSDLALKVGTNTVSWVGDVESITVDGYSRWI